MQAKKSVKLLMGIYSGIGLAVLILIIVLLSTGNLLKRTAGIALPDQGGYVEAWNDKLPQLAQKIGIPEITIYTYKDFDELKTYLSQAEKYNLLWAEVPLSGDYNVADLLKSVEVSKISAANSNLYPTPLYKKIYDTCGQKEIKFIPLSYDPWFTVEKTEKARKTIFKYAIGCDDEATKYAFLQEMKLYTKNDSNENAFKEISKMSRQKILIPNANSYTMRDAFIALENNTVEYCFMNASFFNSLSISQRQNLNVLPFGQNLVTDATIALFPIRKSDENIERVEKAKELLSNPDVIYSVVNARNCIPALTTSVSRSAATESFKVQAKKTSSCYFPQMQYKNTKEKTELNKKLDMAFQILIQD